MPSREQSGTAGGHWEEFWRDAGGDGAVMGGEAQRPALDAYWRGVLGRAAFGPASRALDIASGAAPIARVAAEVLPPARRPKFWCVDYAPSALAAARRLLGPDAALVACDARALPFRPQSFAAVVSQFGLEYAGKEAFGAAAEMVAPNGVFAALVHCRGGVIDAECAENVRIIDAAGISTVIAAARAALSASYAAPGTPNALSIEERAGAAFDAARAALGASGASTGRTLVARYAGDLTTLLARRRAYAPEDALAWIDGVEARLGAYAARMKAMVAAARTGDEMRAIASRLANAGLADVAFQPLTFKEGEPPGAFRLEARRASG